MRVCFFGDSICFGQYISPHKGWVSRIGQLLDAIDNEIILMNPSISGNTTRMALERMSYDALSHHPDVMLIQFGLNDSNCWASDKGLSRVSRKSFSGNLSEMIDKSFCYGAKKVLLNNNHPVTKKFQHESAISYDESSREYNEIIREVAINYGSKVEFTDVEKIFDDKTRKGVEELSKYLLEDGIHLSKKGHDLYYESISSKIVNAVTSLL